MVDIHHHPDGERQLQEVNDLQYQSRAFEELPKKMHG
jgi:hypothetical protein